MQHQYLIKCNDIRLEPLKEADIEYLRKWRNNPNNAIYLRKIEYITEEAQAEWYRQYLQNKDELCFSIIETREINKIVGSASLYNFQKSQIEFGKFLIGDPRAHGKGIGYRVLMEMLKFAFCELKMEKVILSVNEENKAALHIYEKAGFKITSKRRLADGGNEYEMELLKQDGWTG